MSDLVKGLQYRTAMMQFNEAIAVATEGQLIDFTTEIYRQTINRNVILRDLEQGTTAGISAADCLEKEIYPLRLRELSPADLRLEATKRYEQYLSDNQNTGARMKEFFGMGEES